MQLRVTFRPVTHILILPFMLAIALAGHILIGRGAKALASVIAPLASGQPEVTGYERRVYGTADRAMLEVVGVVREKRTTIDLDFQNRPHFGGRHDVVWGLGYRESHFNIGSGTIVSITPRPLRS